MNPRASRPTVPEVYFRDRAVLRAWLAANHDSHGPIWLVDDKKSTGLTGSLTYDELVEAALCLGWIASALAGC